MIASATRIWGANGKRYATWTNDQRRVIQFRAGSDQGANRFGRSVRIFLWGYASTDEPIYSSLKAMAGSVLAARRAGAQQARAAMTNSSTTTAA